MIFLFSQLIVLLLPLSDASPLLPSLHSTLSLLPLPHLNNTLSARNSECFSSHSFSTDPFPPPTYVHFRACQSVIDQIESLRPSTRTFGSSTTSAAHFHLDDTGPWVWPSFRPGEQCYISLHSVEMGDAIHLKMSRVAWKAILILRDCERGLYGGRKWIGDDEERVPGRFYVRVAGNPPPDEPG